MAGGLNVETLDCVKNCPFDRKCGKCATENGPAVALAKKLTVEVKDTGLAVDEKNEGVTVFPTSVTSTLDGPRLLSAKARIVNGKVTRY